MIGTLDIAIENKTWTGKGNIGIDTQKVLLALKIV